MKKEDEEENKCDVKMIEERGFEKKIEKNS